MSHLLESLHFSCETSSHSHQADIFMMWTIIVKSNAAPDMEGILAERCSHWDSGRGQGRLCTILPTKEI